MKSKREELGRDKELLDSWKEISAYLNRSVKTCQRWEHELDLPVHRLDGTPKARVYAYQAELDSWHEQKLRSDEPSEKKLFFKLSTRTRVIRSALGILFITAFVFVLWQVFIQKGIMTVTPDTPYIAVLPFRNNTGATALDNWRTGLANLLATDLQQSRYLRVLPDDRVYSVLEELDALEMTEYPSAFLKKFAAVTGISHILTGDLHKAADNYRIIISLQKVESGEILGTKVSQGGGEMSFFAMVDELNLGIKQDLLLPNAALVDDIDRKIEEITTGSPEAYQYFRRAYREHYAKAEYPECIELLEKAIRIDAEYAIAYLLLGAAYGNLGYDNKFEENIKKGFELRHRASERVSLFYEGYYYQQTQDRDDRKALAAFQKLLDLYPEEAMGLVHLGTMYYRNLEECDKALPILTKRINLAIRDRYPASIAFVTLSDAYQYSGDYNRAEEALLSFFRNFSDNVVVRDRLVENCIYQRDFDRAHVEVERVRFIRPGHYKNFIRKGNIYFFQEDYSQAEFEYQKLVGNREANVKNIGLSKLGALYLTLGRLQRSLDIHRAGLQLSQESGEKDWEFDHLLRTAYVHCCLGQNAAAQMDYATAWEIVGNSRIDEDKVLLLFNRGLLYVFEGAVDEAQREAEKIRSIVDAGINRNRIRYFHNLVGWIAFKTGDYALALDAMQQAISVAPYHPSDIDARFRDSLGQTFLQSGDLENAQKEFLRITDSTYGRFEFGDLYAKSFYYLGKIYVKQGENAEAIRSFNKFLGLWEGADAGTPEVEDTIRSLARLRR